MKILLSLLAAAATTIVPGWTQTAAPKAPVRNQSGDLETMLREARAELESGTAQLASVRAAVDAERLPLARKLDDLEKTLITLRKEYDGVARILDTRNLDVSNLKTELKAREDETFYISNLLDEFIRGFEAKLHIAEATKLATDLVRAKTAAADASLSAGDKFAAQLPPLRSALARSKEVIGGARFRGTALTHEGTVLEGKYALIGPFGLFASDDKTSVGLAINQSGSPQAVVKPLDPKMNQDIAALLASGAGLFPLDSTNGNALKELLNKTNLIDTYKQGGPIMHPLLLTSLIAFSVAIERMVFVLREKRRRRPDLIVEMLDCIEKEDLERAIKIGRSTKDYVAKTLLYALEHREKSLGSALMLAASNELKRFGRGLPVLDTCITVAPLLGLLGTVTGMMHSFSLIGGDLGAPGAITGGIAEALIATAFGLVIAIIALVPFNYLNARLDEARHQIEAAATRLELLMKSKAKPGPADADENDPFKLAASAAAGGGGVH